MGDLLPLRDLEAAVAPLPCPQCGGTLISASVEWWQCSSGACPYEMTAEAHDLYAELLAMIDDDPDGFFAIVQAYRDEVRALEPAWLRC